MNKWLFVFFVFLVFSCQSKPQWSDVPPSQFIQVSGQQFVGNDQEFIIKAIAFGNQIWENPTYSSKIMHHQEIDYTRVRKMGFNSVRFYLSEALFQKDGFDWLDKNIAWAKKAGVFLLLNMHYPPGGYQSNGKGDALWLEKSNQDRLVKLWKSIAKRYAKEEQILGYGLVNEPVPVGSYKAWKNLAQRLIVEIRDEDPWHILFVERALYLKNSVEPYSLTASFPLVKDPGPRQNIVLEYHHYDPLEFTHQGAEWVPGLQLADTQYPDPNHVIQNAMSWKGTTSNTSTLQSNSDWKFLEGEVFEWNIDSSVIVKPAIQFENLGKNGQGWIRNLAVERVMDEGPHQVVWKMDAFIPNHWGFWSKDGNGRLVTQQSPTSSAEVLGTTSDANITWLGDPLALMKGRRYRISGWVKAQNLGSRALIRLRLDQYEKMSKYEVWDKKYVFETLKPILEIGKARNQPVFLGEFGTIAKSFQNNRGGDRWVKDMLEILKENKLSFSYHAYHEPAFGLYTSWNTFPQDDEKNQTLEKLFIEELQD